MQRICRPYDEVRPLIADADLLLFGHSSLEGKAISIGGRSDYSHAAMAAWWGSRLFCLELHGRYGGRAILLSNYLATDSGRIDVYRSNPADRWQAFSRQRAVEAMKELMGQRYAWLDLLRVSMIHLPITRWFFTPPSEDKEADGKPFFCSGACSHAYRCGGHKPVPNLSDHWVEPGDLARSDFFLYRFTLTRDFGIWGFGDFGPHLQILNPQRKVGTGSVASTTVCLPVRSPATVPVPLCDAHKSPNPSRKGRIPCERAK